MKAYLELQASWGITRHLGGLKATRELMELCNIDKDEYVLDVGCGVGATPCYLAKKQRCKVVGIDVSATMIDLSKERAKREGVEDKVEFRVADAQDLPFDDYTFDSVVAESVIVFTGDKRRAIGECARVVKPGGHVGLNEPTWIKTDPPAELIEYYLRITGARLETSNDWEGLLKGAGLRDIVTRTHKLSITDKFDELSQYSLMDKLRYSYRFLSAVIKSPDFRGYAKEASRVPKNVLKFAEYLGYGLYVGRK